jgi:hypothetical protein
MKTFPKDKKANGNLKAILNKGPRNKVQWNQTFLLVKNVNLVSKHLDISSRPKQIKLWFILHGIILEEKPIGLDKKKSFNESSWFGEPKFKLMFKVGDFFVFLFSSLFSFTFVAHFFENGKHL